MSDNEHYQLCPSPNTKKKRPHDYDDCIFTSSSKMSRVDKGKNNEIYPNDDENTQDLFKTPLKKKKPF